MTARMEHVPLSNWDVRFLGLAAYISNWSKDESTKCGCVIARPDKTIASLGFNGFPRGLRDDPRLLLERDRKYERVIHAEMNALLFLREQVEGFTMYVWPMLPCNRCAVHVIQAGIGKVVAPAIYIDRWRDSVKLTRSLFDEAGVIMREAGHEEIGSELGGAVALRNISWGSGPGQAEGETLRATPPPIPGGRRAQTGGV